MENERIKKGQKILTNKTSKKLLLLVEVTWYNSSLLFVVTKFSCNSMGSYSGNGAKL